eukprot:c16430_g1_i1.p1 GENE.c16430_g1_i1~~c16430_g1_i1.p1  ORF type:complete len:271 (-),score=91.13 c16430_g1_i1:65-877(-)
MHPDVKNHSEIAVVKKTFYSSENDSTMSKLFRYLRCGCCAPKYELTTEGITIHSWQDCSWNSNSIDVDNIKDLSLHQAANFGYCCCGRGHMKLYVQNPNTRLVMPTDIRNIENAEKVFEEFSSHLHKINNLQHGLKRPSIANMAFIFYDSHGDSDCIKCYRTFVCCACHTYPHTIVSKERITTKKWSKCCHKIVLQMDLDNVKSVRVERGCCEECCCDAGTIHVEGRDMDQDGLHLRNVEHAQQVFDKLNEYVSVLNNRQRVTGNQHMVK